MRERKIVVKAYVMTFAFFLGKVPVEVLRDLEASTRTKLIYAQVCVVLPNRNAIRKQLSAAAKTACMHAELT